jgi:hypothetical protein
VAFSEINHNYSKTKGRTHVETDAGPDAVFHLAESSDYGTA